jgi:hypothetical protein
LENFFFDFPFKSLLLYYVDSIGKSFFAYLVFIVLILSSSDFALLKFGDFLAVVLVRLLFVFEDFSGFFGELDFCRKAGKIITNEVEKKN